MTSENSILAKIEALFSDHGADWYMGEPVTMAEHMLQSAFFAMQAGADDELIIAALLHDIGHYTSEYAEDCLQKGIDNEHEDSAADFLAGHFPQRVLDAIRLHVASKRYLCAVKPEYYEVLSEASKESLAVQGGPMNTDEVAQFEAEPYHQDAVKVRYWDDAGKQDSLTVPDLNHYIPMMQKLLIQPAA